MNRLHLWLVPAIVLSGCAQALPQSITSIPAPKPGPGVFFVATNGNDQWSGRLPKPNRAGTDGPFATLPGALKTVRELRQRHDSAAGQSPTVFVGGGFYFLDAPVVLTPEDSGLVLAAWPQARPVLSGGRPITGWKEVTVEGKKLWAADIPSVREGKWYFRELWVNGQRATRARHPNRGYLAIAELPDKAAEWTQGQTRFRFRQGDLKAWDTITNAEVIAMTKWVESRLPVIGVDEKEHIDQLQQARGLRAGDRATSIMRKGPSNSWTSRVSGISTTRPARSTTCRVRASSLPKSRPLRPCSCRCSASRAGPRPGNSSSAWCCAA